MFTAFGYPVMDCSHFKFFILVSNMGLNFLYCTFLCNYIYVLLLDYSIFLKARHDDDLIQEKITLHIMY